MLSMVGRRNMLTKVAVEFEDSASVAVWLGDAVRLSQGLHLESCEEPELLLKNQLNQLLDGLFDSRLVKLTCSSGPSPEDSCQSSRSLSRMIFGPALSIRRIKR